MVGRMRLIHDRKATTFGSEIGRQRAHTHTHNPPRLPLVKEGVAAGSALCVPGRLRGLRRGPQVATLLPLGSEGENHPP